MCVCVCVCVNDTSFTEFNLVNIKFFVKYSLLVVLGLRCCAGVSLAVLSGARLHGSGLSWAARARGHSGFSPCGSGLSSCGSRALEHRLSIRGARLSCLQLVGSSWTKDQTLVSGTGRRILYLWATREALLGIFVKSFRMYFPDGSWCLVFLCVCVFAWFWFWSDPHLIEYSGKHSVFFNFLKVFVRN